MSLTLYNTLTRRKELFEPIDPANVRLYVCGPTVYDDAHIGNARPVIVFDVLFRLLRHLYGAGHVTYVRNITDIDDKIIARAAERGIPIADLTAETERRFHEDAAALGCLPPTVEPRATEHIPQMIAMISALIARAHAYEAQGHVLFEVTSMPGYGRLSGRSTDEMIAGARVEVAPYKKHPMDFVLWKPSGPDEPGWESPWGRGRPGWHIECSAMSKAHLGPVFDIHGGGVDLVFPHHENEIAQSTCAHGTTVMANVWMHNGYLQVEGEKMSKSLGNFVTIRELLEGWQDYAWPGEVLRFNMLRTHYRQPLDWTLHGLDESHKILWDWYGRLDGVEPVAEVPDVVIGALLDDLNTPQAIAEMHRLANEQRYGDLQAALHFLGFGGERDGIVLVRNVHASDELRVTIKDRATVEPVVNERIAARTEARKAKNFAEADRIRDELARMGIQLKDSKDPVTGELVTTWEIAR